MKKTTLFSQKGLYFGFLLGFTAGLSAVLATAVFSKLMEANVYSSTQQSVEDNARSVSNYLEVEISALSDSLRVYAEQELKSPGSHIPADPEELFSAESWVYAFSIWKPNTLSQRVDKASSWEHPLMVFSADNAYSSLSSFDWKDWMQQIVTLDDSLIQNAVKNTAILKRFQRVPSPNLFGVLAIPLNFNRIDKDQPAAVGLLVFNLGHYSQIFEQNTQVSSSLLDDQGHLLLDSVKHPFTDAENSDFLLGQAQVSGAHCTVLSKMPTVALLDPLKMVRKQSLIFMFFIFSFFFFIGYFSFPRVSILFKVEEAILPEVDVKPAKTTLTGSLPSLTKTDLSKVTSNVVGVHVNSKTRWLVNNGSQIIGPMSATEIAQALFTQELDFDSECWVEGLGNPTQIRNAKIFSGSEDEGAEIWVFDGQSVHGPLSPGFLKTALSHKAISLSGFYSLKSTVSGWRPLSEIGLIPEALNPDLSSRIQPPVAPPEAMKKVA